jgi:hypothetical protein
MLALKTIHPMMLGYSLKFVNYIIEREDKPGSIHLPQMLLDDEIQHEHRKMWEVSDEVLGNYCIHDVRETVNVFRAVWEQVQLTSPKNHWEPYITLELGMGEPLHEMMLLGREYICIDKLRDRLKHYKDQLARCIENGDNLSFGHIPNICSTHQIDAYFRLKKWKPLDRSEKGKPILSKADKLQGLLLVDKEDDNAPRFKHTDPKQTRAFSESQYGKEVETNLKVPDSIKWATNRRETFLYWSYEANKHAKIVSYFRSYLRAGLYERERTNGNNSERTNSGFHAINFAISSDERRCGNRPNKESEVNSKSNSYLYIPKGYRISAARTRRFRSGLRGQWREKTFGINAQNQTKESKQAQIVPFGWLAWYIDSTQIENVAHIFFSHDETRREAYETEEDWNEYVWLYNQAYGKEVDKAELEKDDSPINPNWSMYKQFKTVKLALNFGMGVAKFCKTTGLAKREAELAFEDVHRACPAIRKLQQIVKKAIKEKGYVEDPWHHIYSGNLTNAYKVVAHWVQGCGTGSVPKAMTIANWKTIHHMDSHETMYTPWILHPYTGMFSYGVLTGTTHDECAGRLSLGLPIDKIIHTLRELMYNMEGRFSNKFKWKGDKVGIPLKAKLYISIDNAGNQIEVNHRKSDFDAIITEYIRKGRRQYVAHFAGN